MRLRLKAKLGTKVLSIEDASISLKNFLCLVEESFNESDGNNLKVRDIKTGFPPKSIELNDFSTPINQKGINNGEQIIVEFESDTQSASASFKEDVYGKEKKESQSAIPSIYISELSRHLILRNIPDDNSCLFNAISYCTNGPSSYQDGGSSAMQLRSIVVNCILSNPDLYNIATLERSPEDYCKWIKKKDSWGGAIELGILADWFNIRIDCIDVYSGALISFKNEQKDASHFIILVYSGIHYDVLSLNPVVSTNRESYMKDESIWPTDISISEILAKKSMELCRLLQSKDYSTNTTKFRIRCLECYEILIGEIGASKHANDTGHYRFGEVKN